MPEYETVDPLATVTVTTAIPYTSGTEYRQYSVSSDELPLFLADLDDPQLAERVVDVEPDGSWTTEDGDHDGE